MKERQLKAMHTVHSHQDHGHGSQEASPTPM